jgi:DNA polymerase
MSVLHIDFETRSECDILKSGAWAYAQHPTTEVLCACWCLDDGDINTWYNTEGCIPFGTDLNHSHIAGHNVEFEYAIWKHIMVPKYGWPKIKPEQLLDTMAQCAVCTYPLSLKGASQAMGITQQKQDNSVMLKLSKPDPQYDKKMEKHNIHTNLYEECMLGGDVRKDLTHDIKFTHVDGSVIKVNKEALRRPTVFIEDDELFKDLIEYCKQDVEVERQVYNELPKLSEVEQAYFVDTIKMNEAGVPVDVPFVEQAIKISESIELTPVDGLTMKDIKNPKSFIKYMNNHGYPIKSCTELKNLKIKEEDVLVSENVDIRIQATKSSVAKFKSMLEKQVKGRVQGNLCYHGASTGRDAGRGLQIQNLPRPSFKNIAEIKEAIRSEDLVELSALTDGKPNHGLSSCIRSAITGKFIASDYSSIEARAVCWLAGDEEALEIFRTGQDIYVDMAKEIYQKEDISKDERALGKQAILGLGYGMGAKKFKETCAGYGIEIPMDPQDVVNVYRKKYSKVRGLWYGLEDAFKLAMHSNNAGKCFSYRNIHFKMKNGDMRCLLPSGRLLYYIKPILKRVYNEHFDSMKDEIQYKGINSFTRKFEYLKTYSGKLCENVTQAVARDIMRHATHELFKTGKYQPIMLVHDEIVSEYLGEPDLDEYNKILCTLPDWAEGCPIEAEGWIGEEYRK